MRSKRTFSVDFKRQLVEKLLSSESGVANICRQYNICVQPALPLEGHNSRGRFNNGHIEIKALKDRTEKL